jgi:hypothetical protein
MMTVSGKVKSYVITFFKCILDRKFSDADRALKALEEMRFSDIDFKAGYLNALEGILLSSRSGDVRDFINRATFDRDAMERYKEEFIVSASNGVRNSFDTGYFSAWSDFMQYKLTLKN